MSDRLRPAPPQLCVFGPPADGEWLQALLAGVPAALRVALYGARAATAPDDERVARALLPDCADAAAVVRDAATRYPNADLFVVRAGTVLPPWWHERLARALAEADVLAAAPLDNVDPERAPLPESGASELPPARIDALCWRYGRRQLLDWPTLSPLLSAWSGTRLRTIDAARIASAELPADLAPLRAVLLDHLYVADPQRPLRGPAPAAPGSDAAPPSALGELREQLGGAVEQLASGSAADERAAYPGLDGKPVVLHVLHGWGGGAERFVRDLAAADDERHHLVLIARGSFVRRTYGESLELRDGALSEPPLRRLVLPNPIRSTALQHRTYAAFLYAITREFGVSAVIVSSLIGHSLDALRTSLPTALAGHDFYPLWPLLHRDFGDAALRFDAAQLQADIAGAGAAFEFAERDARYWRALREAYVDAALAAGVQLVAPSRAMLDNLLRIEPRLSLLPRQVIAHGLAPWPEAAARPGTPPPRERLRLVIPGRIRAGKGAALLQAALPQLRPHAEVFLLGAGAEGEQFFGAAGVHIVLNYRRDDLPALLAQLAPDAALLLPTVAETFSYTLSELMSLGVPVVATRVGALAERIVDGLDGWLVAPDAQSIVDRVALLQRDRASIDQVRNALQSHRPRDIAAMAADWRAALPLDVAAAARYALTAASADRLMAATRAAQLGSEQRSNRLLRERVRADEQELARRADWGMALDKDLERARRRIDAQDDIIEQRTRWAQEADAHTAAVRAELQQLAIDFDERTRWAKSLDAELADMRASTSWRITRPLRYLKRRLQALRVRAGFVLQRLRSLGKRTRGSLASRGTVGTLRRIGDEFRRSGHAPALAAVPEPTSDFAPFAVPDAEAPRVSIVVPVYNKIDYTVACLRSLAEHAGPTPFDIVVVDDASSDATAERLAQIDGVHVVRNGENRGFVGSCNAGAAVARGEFVLFLNNDTVVTPGWLEALLQVFEDEPDAGLAGARLVYPDGRLQEAGGIVFRDGSGWNYGRFDDPADPRYSFRREADYCSGAAIVLRRELFERLGGFDPRYAPAYYEDTDLAFAVRAAGLKVFYEPRATVVHFEGVSAGTDVAGSGMKRFQAVNRDTFAEKWKKELERQPAPIHEARLAAAAANWRARGRILIVDAYTPTPDQDSGSLRMLNLMRLLRELGYAVAFLPDNRAHAGPYTEALQALGVEALYHPFVADPVAWLREQGGTLDAVVLSRHYIAVNYLGPVRLYAPQARLIFDTVDLHYLREERAAALEGKAELARHAAQTKAQELKIMRSADVTLVVSAAEKRLLDAELPGARIEVLSNVHAVHGCRTPFGERRDLVFVGGFQHPPNIDAVVWFVANVMPLIREHGDGMRLHVIGSKAPPQVLALAADDVVVHGYVEDIAPYMDGCRISVAPLRYGAGVKGKINMAMSYGLPVVATTLAVEGMHVRAEEDIVVADSAADFAAAIVRLYHDEALWQKLSRNGLTNVGEHFSFDAARAALLRVLPQRR